MRLGHALDQRPVDLLRRPLAEGLGELLRGEPGARDDEDAGGRPVEAVDQPRLLALRVAERFEQRIDVAGQARAALHGESRRLVEDEDVVVLVEEERAEEVGVLSAGFVPGVFVA